MVVRVKWGGAGARQGPNIPVMSVLSMPWLSPFWNQPLISTLLLLWNRKGIHWKLGFGMLDQIQWIIVFSTSVPFFLQVVCFKMIPLKMRSLEKMIISPNTKISSEVDWHPHTKSPQLPETFFFFSICHFPWFAEILHTYWSNHFCRHQTQTGRAWVTLPLEKKTLLVWACCLCFIFDTKKACVMIFNCSQRPSPR